MRKLAKRFKTYKKVTTGFIFFKLYNVVITLFYFKVILFEILVNF